MVSIDFNGLSILVAAIAAAAGSIVNTVLTWRAKNEHNVDKKEAIEAREQQNVILDQVHANTNGAKTALEKQNAELLKEIARLQGLPVEKIVEKVK